MAAWKTVNVCEYDVARAGVGCGECYACRLQLLQRRLDELVAAVRRMRQAEQSYREFVWLGGPPGRSRSPARNAGLQLMEAEAVVDRMLEELEGEES
jgi:hypothetical protein